MTKQKKQKDKDIETQLIEHGLRVHRLLLYVIITMMIFYSIISALGYYYELFFPRFESAFFKEGVRSSAKHADTLRGTMIGLIMSFGITKATTSKLNDTLEKKKRKKKKDKKK